MESITIYPRNEKQKNLLKSLLKELNINFEMADSKDVSLISKKVYFEKIDKAIKQAESGDTKNITIEMQKELLGL